MIYQYNTKSVINNESVHKSILRHERHEKKQRPKKEENTILTAGAAGESQKCTQHNFDEK